MILMIKKSYKKKINHFFAQKAFQLKSLLFVARTLYPFTPSIQPRIPYEIGDPVCFRKIRSSLHVDQRLEVHVTTTIIVREDSAIFALKNGISRFSRIVGTARQGTTDFFFHPPESADTCFPHEYFIDFVFCRLRVIIFRVLSLRGRSFRTVRAKSDESLHQQNALCR